ncbi:MAG TPA: hypothetical protein VMT20_15610 [Terriglobia bacterium]|nr:hypothetical protein [Terriglobia bacterium]
MTFIRNLAFTLGAVLALATASWSQGMGMMHPPEMPGQFNPVVGSGGEYEITHNGQTVNWTYAVVGKETVNGQEGYWLEMRTETPRGKMVMKQLMVTQPGKVQIERMIMQPPGRPPMEMPMAMMSRMGGGAHPAPASDHPQGELVGTESVTVPAGTFTAEHFRSTTDGKTNDVWASTKVAPYGLVKMTSADTTMVLVKALDHETSQITGEPQKMNIPGMPQ